MREALFFCTLAKSLDFETRASRLEYWVFSGIFIVLAIACLVVDVTQHTFNPRIGLGLYSGVLVALLFIPNLAVTIRRLHDTDRSGWFFLVSLIPLVGGLVLLVFVVPAGTVGPNRFGEDPRRIKSGQGDSLDPTTVESSPSRVDA